MDGEHRSPFFAFIVNLFIPGAIFWHLGHRFIGGAIIVSTLSILPISLSLFEEERSAAGIHLFLGVTTGLLAFALIARKEMQR